MKKFRILIITAYRMCISNILQCIHLCTYILHVQGVDQNIFEYGIKLDTVLLYIDSIFTILTILTHYTRLHFLKN